MKRPTLPTTRLFWNVSANMVGGAWTGALILLATPWFVKLLGLEGYGLLGFWLLMQMMLSLVELGLGATLVKEFAHAGEPEVVGERRRDLLRTFEWVYWSVAALVCVLILVLARPIATRWLNITVFTPDEVTHAMQWMAIALGLQYPGSLYSSGLAGLQLQGRMNAIQVAGMTARYGGGVAVLLWRPDPAAFFVVQAIVSALQTLGTRAVLRHCIGSAQVADRLDLDRIGMATVAGRAPRFDAAIVRRVWRYSIGMAATSVAALLVGNVDRLFLSKLLPAAELGKYSLAFTATGLLQMGIQPFYRAYFPRFAELSSVGDRAQLRHEYFAGSRMVGAIVIPFALIGWFFAPEIFTAWVGQADPTVVAVFRCLVIAISCTGLMWLPAAFQQAQGWTRLHAGMIAGALIVGVPIMWWALRAYGTVGATVVWLLHGLSGITIELVLMHRRLLVGELAQWYRRVVLVPLAPAGLVVLISVVAHPANLGRWGNLLWIGATGLIVTASTLALARRTTPWRGREVILSK